MFSPETVDRYVHESYVALHRTARRPDQPAVLTAMAEIGLDLTTEYPKPLTDDVARAAE